MLTKPFIRWLVGIMSLIKNRSCSCDISSCIRKKETPISGLLPALTYGKNRRLLPILSLSIKRSLSSTLQNDVSTTSANGFHFFNCPKVFSVLASATSVLLTISLSAIIT